MNHAPGAGSITCPVDHYATASINIIINFFLSMSYFCYCVCYDYIQLYLSLAQVLIVRYSAKYPQTLIWQKQNAPSFSSYWHHIFMFVFVEDAAWLLWSGNDRMLTTDKGNKRYHWATTMKRQCFASICKSGPKYTLATICAERNNRYGYKCIGNSGMLQWNETKLSVFDN